MVTLAMRTSRRRRHGELGFTLIEVLVSIAILAIIGGVVATAYSVGLSILQPGGPQTRFLASHNLMVMEQVLGKDGARASCVKVPGSGTYGACSKNFPSANCPAADLCFGWPQVSDSTCHVSDYAVGSGVVATRTEYVAGVATPAQADTLTRESPVNIVIDVANVKTVTPTGESYTWLRSLPVTVTGTGLANPPSQKLVLHPIASDPAGASSQITASGSPC